MNWRRFTPRRRGRRGPQTGPAEPTCREAVELVTAYLDDALAPGSRAALERHLADCPHCSEYFIQIRLVREAAGRIEPEDLAPQARLELTALFEQWRTDPGSGADAGVDAGPDDGGGAGTGADAGAGDGAGSDAGDGAVPDSDTSDR